MNRLDPDIVRLLDAVYLEPEPIETAEELARFHHDDVVGLSLEQIDAERILCRLRWAVTVYRRAEPSRWLLGRIPRLDQAASRLREGQRR